MRLGAAGVRAAASAIVHPQAAPRRRRGEEARLHREVHPAGRDRPAADPRALRRAARRRDRASSSDVLERSRKVVEHGARRRQAASKAAKPKGDGAARRQASAHVDGGRASATSSTTRSCSSRSATPPPSVHQEILQAAASPTSRFPVRSLANVTYSTRSAATSRSAAQKKVRTLTVNTVKSFAQTLRMMALSKELVETQRLRHQARRLLPEQELGARRASTSRPSPTR